LAGTINDAIKADSSSRGGEYGAYFLLVTSAGAVLAAQIALIVSEDGKTAFTANCFTVG